MQKRYPNSDQNGLQKGPQKWATISNMGSKRHPKMGFQKNIKKCWFSGPSNVAHVLQITAKSMKFKFWCWPPFGSHFGGVLGAQMEAKASKKVFQKNIKKRCPTWAKTGPQMGSQSGAKIVKNDVLGSPLHKGGSQVASRPPPSSILDRFWDHLF